MDTPKYEVLRRNRFAIEFVDGAGKEIPELAGLGTCIRDIEQIELAGCRGIPVVFHFYAYEKYVPIVHKWVEQRLEIQKELSELREQIYKIRNLANTKNSEIYRLDRDTLSLSPETTIVEKGFWKLLIAFFTPGKWKTFKTYSEFSTEEQTNKFKETMKKYEKSRAYLIEEVQKVRKQLEELPDPNLKSINIRIKLLEYDLETSCSEILLNDVQPVQYSFDPLDYREEGTILTLTVKVIAASGHTT